MIILGVERRILFWRIQRVMRGRSEIDRGNSPMPLWKQSHFWLLLWILNYSKHITTFFYKLDVQGGWAELGAWHLYNKLQADIFAGRNPWFWHYRDSSLIQQWPLSDYGLVVYSHISCWFQIMAVFGSSKSCIGRFYLLSCFWYQIDSCYVVHITGGKCSKIIIKPVASATIFWIKKNQS